jgi:hypothetical protein
MAHRTIAVVTLLLLVLFLTTPAAAKKKATHLAFKGAHPFIRCPVCVGAVTTAADRRDVLLANATAEGRKLREEDLWVDTLDVLCNPHTEAGDWLRRISWDVFTANNSVTMHFMQGWAHCRRQCTTAAEVCAELLQSDAIDDLSPKLLKGAPADELIPFACAEQCSEAAAKRVGRKHRVQAAWGAEKWEEIHDKEKEVEEMMERQVLQGQAGPGVDVMSRDEMMGMQDAMRAGDQDRLAELDPAMGDLSDEEFAALRQMQLEKDANDGQ